MVPAGIEGARRVQRIAVLVALSCLAPAAAVVLGGAPAAAQTVLVGPGGRPAVELPLVGDDHPGLLERRRRDARDLAVQGVLGATLQPGPDPTVVELAAAAPDETFTDPTTPVTSAYAEIATVGVDQVLTLLVDFGPGDYAERTWNGPVHGQLVASGPRDSTPEARTSDPAHYEQLLFGAGHSSLASYLAAQSGGRYGIEGSVQGWVAVPYNAAHYGADECGGSECADRVAELAADAVDAFVEDFYARDPAGDLAAFLEPYDRRDRYDADADGDFTEPDGYLDRLVLVFAGDDQATSGIPDRVTSRFGSVAQDTIGGSGPAGNQLGGHELGSSGVWIDAFSALPEDAGLGQVIHTYAHDLGLADLADSSGVAELDSSVQFWSPMAAGSRLATGDSGLGGTAPDLLAAERLQLGWAVPAVVGASQAATVTLAADRAERLARRSTPPAEGVGAPPGGATPDAVVIPLGELPATRETATPAAGALAFVAANREATTAVLELPLLGGEERVGWRQWTETEPVFDALRIQAFDGTAWHDIAPAATGTSGWTSRFASIPTGMSALRFLYTTDQVTTGAGVLLDEIRLDDAPAEGAEAGIPTTWTASGWAAGDGTIDHKAPAFYVAERRDQSGYDAGLQSGPYVADPRRGTASIDRFGYADGVLVSLWDWRAEDNYVSAHPASGRLLVVDARPEPATTTSGAAAPPGLGAHDAAFGSSWLRGFSVDAYAVSVGGEVTAERVRVRAQPPVPTFDDTDARYAGGAAGQPALPGMGVTMTIVAENRAGTTLQLGPPAP